MRDMMAKPEFVTVEAEQQLLGALLVDNRVMDRISGMLSADHFYDPLHREIWTICAGRIAKGHLASPVTIKVAMEGHEGLAQVGGPAYLARLAGASIAGTMAPDYARLIFEAWVRRELASKLDEARLGLGGDDLPVLIAKLQHALEAVPQVEGGETTYSMMSAVTEAVRGAVAAYSGTASYLSTGLTALDAIVRGLAPGDLMILGGTTSMGKTSVALEIARHVSTAGNKGVAFVSLEMSREQLATRLISASARVPYSDIRNADQMEEAAFRSWVEKSREVGAAAMQIVPKHVRDIPSIHAACKRARNQMGEGAPLSLIVVDYAQLVRGEGKTRYEQMTSVSIGLKTLAGLMGCPVIGLVQLSRDIGFRDDKRPQLSDIKETGQFENDADQVVFCHREDYWLERAGPRVGKNGDITAEARADWESDLTAARNKMELIVRKNRHGRLATAQVGFHAPTNRFWSLADDRRDWDE